MFEKMDISDIAKVMGDSIRETMIDIEELPRELISSYVIRSSNDISDIVGCRKALIELLEYTLSELKDIDNEDLYQAKLQAVVEELEHERKKSNKGGIR